MKDKCYTLKVEAVGSTETSINSYQTTRRRIPDDRLIFMSGTRCPNVRFVTVEDSIGLTDRSFKAIMKTI